MKHRKRGIDGEELLSYIRSRCTVTDTNCHLWQGAVNDKNYGTIKYNKETKRVHVLVYELTIGKIPIGLELDHLCKSHNCCNLDHLEAVTHKVNVERGNLKFVSKKLSELITHCPKGHEYSGSNLYVNSRGHRICRTCAIENQRKRRLLYV